MISLLGPSWKSSKKAPKRCLKTALCAPHFYEDVSGEMAIFENRNTSRAISEPQLFRGCLRRNRHFQHKVLQKRTPQHLHFRRMSQAKRPFWGTFPDMNGKRVKGQSFARHCSSIATKCNIAEFSERSQATRMDTRTPNVHKRIPDAPPHSHAEG